MKYVIFSIISIIGIIINLFIINDRYLFLTPFFALAPKLYKIVSSIVYLFVFAAIFIIFFKDKTYTYYLNAKLKIIVLINFFLYTLYNLFSFIIISPFLTFSIKTFQFVAALYLNEEVAKKNKVSVNLLTFYILWTFYLTLISISIFFINNS